MNMKQDQNKIKETNLYRRLLAVSGSIYLFWWFAVQMLLPGSFNPFGGRLLVVSFIFSVLIASYINLWVKHHLRILLICCTWLITLHYFYLFYGNAGDTNWVMGSYITIIAISLCFSSKASLLSYSIFVISLSILLVFLLPSMKQSIFLPGLLTIVFQANIGLRSRLGLIKDLTESNERFQLLFNSTFEGVLVHEKGIILDVNESLLNMLGFTQKELIGVNILTLLPDGERAQIDVKMKVADLVPIETKFIAKDQRIIDVEARAKDFFYNKLPCRLVTVLDISDRKQIEKERIAALTLAENLRIRDDFISIASHELRTPISTLLLQVQLIERDLNKKYPTENRSEAITLFKRQIQRLTELVSTMLDVSRISAGRFTLDLKKVDLGEIVREVVGSLLNLQRTHSTSKIEIEAPLHIIFMADPVRIEQVVENLLTNALKYGEGKPIIIRLKIEDKDVLLSVEDHGLGIAPEFISRIFDRFERAISSRNITGFGLGLYIVRKIVEAHSGSIQIESRLGVGSTFTVRIPMLSEKLNS